MDQINPLAQAIRDFEDEFLMSYLSSAGQIIGFIQRFLCLKDRNHCPTQICDIYRLKFILAAAKYREERKFIDEFDEFTNIPIPGTAVDHGGPDDRIGDPAPLDQFFRVNPDGFASGLQRGVTRGSAEINRPLDVGSLDGGDDLSSLSGAKGGDIDQDIFPFQGFDKGILVVKISVVEFDLI